MASKAILLFSLIIMFSSYLHVGLCQTSLDQLLSSTGGGNFLQDAQCVQKLLPCQEYVKTQSDPSEACCAPLKEMHETNTQCLCNFINKPQILQSISVSKENVLKLPQACGITVDLDKCNNTTEPQGASSSAALEGEESSEDGTSDAESSSTKMITPYGVPGFVALLIALVFSSY